MADQYKIPQNIDVEDKILGPFTLKQFLYLLGGGVTIYILFNIFGQTNFTLFLIIALPIGIATLLLVFIKVNERPFLDFFLYFTEFLRQGKVQKWEKSSRLKKVESNVQMSETEKVNQKDLAKLAKQGIVKSQLDNLSVILDTSGWSGKIVDDTLQGRIGSKQSAGSVVEQTLGTQDVEDVFEDLENAFDKVLNR